MTLNHSNNEAPRPARPVFHFEFSENLAKQTLIDSQALDDYKLLLETMALNSLKHPAVNRIVSIFELVSFHT